HGCDTTMPLMGLSRSSPQTVTVVLAVSVADRNTGMNGFLRQ
ncbi:hypothetical protein A2U01_0118495, partial [Trifolium medium]|nr:hypothetical protein [Trifolium medium]